MDKINYDDLIRRIKGNSKYDDKWDVYDKNVWMFVINICHTKSPYAAEMDMEVRWDKAYKAIKRKPKELTKLYEKTNDEIFDLIGFFYTEIQGDYDKIELDTYHTYIAQVTRFVGEGGDDKIKDKAAVMKEFSKIIAETKEVKKRMYANSDERKEILNKRSKELSSKTKATNWETN